MYVRAVRPRLQARARVCVCVCVCECASVRSGGGALLLREAKRNLSFSPSSRLLLSRSIVLSRSLSFSLVLPRSLSFSLVLSSPSFPAGLPGVRHLLRALSDKPAAAQTR